MRPPFLFFRSCSHLRIFVLDYNQTKHIKNKKMKKQFLSSIPEVFEEMQHTNGTQATKRSWLGLGKTVESYWYILVVFFGMLLLYAMARIISLQRRVRDLEARPPVDDITLRGAVRLQLNDLVSDLEQTLRAKQTDSSTSHLSPPPPSIPIPIPYPAPAPSFARKQDVVDEELNQVLEIANSVKASLPDVKLFANAMKMQKQKSKENEKEKEKEMEKEKSKDNEKEMEKEKSKENEKEMEKEKEVEKVEKTETNEEVKEEKVNEEVKQKIEDKIEMEVEKEQINIENQKQEEQDVPRWSTPVLKKEKEKEKEKKLKIANSSNFKRGAGAKRKGDTDTVDKSKE
jgi:DNA polymerase III gamma/tau subunit